MNDMLGSDVRKVHHGVPETPRHAGPAEDRFGPVTYTIKVLSGGSGEGGEGLRTVLFRRTSRGESIEISAETDAPNLLAKLPELLEAALEIRREVGRLPARFSPLVAEESRLVRRLTQGGPAAERHEGAPRTQGVLHVIRAEYRALPA